jgi:hypothetical protein
MKPSTGAAVRLHRNAVRDRPESLSAFKWNACPPSPEYPTSRRSAGNSGFSRPLVWRRYGWAYRSRVGAMRANCQRQRCMHVERQHLCPLGRDASLGSAICWQIRDLREVRLPEGFGCHEVPVALRQKVERPTPAVPCRRRSDPGEFRWRREARRVARRIGTWWNLFVLASPSHAETNNSACTIAACGGALENRVAVAAFAQRGNEYFICLTGRGLSTHVEGA